MPIRERRVKSRYAPRLFQPITDRTPAEYVVKPAPTTQNLSIPPEPSIVPPEDVADSGKVIPGVTHAIVDVEGIPSVWINGVPIPVNAIQDVLGIQSVVLPNTMPVPLTTYAPSLDIDTVNKQIEYWQSQIKQAQDVLDTPETDIEHPLDRAGIQKDIENYQNKIALLNQQIEAGVPSPQISIITSPEMQPYITVNKDGTYTIDVSGIIRADMDPLQMKKLGITDEAISQVKALNSLITYKTSGGGYNIAKAVEDGKEDLLLNAGFTKEQIADVKKYIEARKKVEAQQQTESKVKLSAVKTGGHEIDTINELLVTNNGYNALTDEFMKMDIETQQDFIAEALYDMPNASKKSFDQLTDAQRKRVIEYFASGKISKEQLAKYQDNKLAKASFLVATAGAADVTPVNEIVATILLMVGITSVTISQRKTLQRAVEDFIASYGRAPAPKEISVTKKGETVEFTVATPAPSSTIIDVPPKIDTSLPLDVPAKIDTSGLIINVPPRIDAKIPSYTPPKIDTRLPLDVPAKIDIPNLITSVGIASTRLAELPAVKRVTTVRERQDLLFPMIIPLDTLASKTSSPGHSYITANNIWELDQKVAQAYITGSLSRDEYLDYQRARIRYLTAKYSYDSTMVELTTSVPQLNQTKLPHYVIGAALLTAIDTAKKLKKGKKQIGGGAILPKVIQATQAKVESMVGGDVSTKDKEIIRRIAEIGTLTVTGTITLPETKQATQTLTATQTATQTAVKTATKTATKVATATAVATQESTAEAAKEAEAVKEAEATLTAELTATGAKLPFIGGGTGAKEHIAIPRKGAVAWAQGIGWWTRWHPYGKKEMKFSHLPPDDAVLVKDSKSAYDTIQTISGLPPGKIPKQDMGVFDVFVDKPPRTPRRSNRAAIKFKRDPNVASKPRQKSTVRNRKVGVYYTAGRMVSRHPIGKRKRG